MRIVGTNQEKISDMINPFTGFFTKSVLKQFFVYHIRWQSGIIVYYPAMQFALHVLNFPFFAALLFSNICGGCVFFFVDRVIFGINNKK